MAHVVHSVLDLQNKYKKTLQTTITETRIFTAEIVDITETIIYAELITLNKACLT